MEIRYKIIFHKEAMKDLSFWKKSGNVSAQKKITAILKILQSDPYHHSMQFEFLSENLSGYCSRRITKKDRVTYFVNEKNKEVVVARPRGHYS
jgi:toxin YoeB